MKKILTVMLLVLLPAMVFADFQIGPTALYDFPIVGEEGYDDIGFDDFTFGLDTRLNLSIFQASAYVLYTPGNEDFYPSIDAYPSLDAYFDLGLTFKLWFLRLSAGIGPSMSYIFTSENVDEGELFNAGLNMKLTGDIELGDISIGLVYLTDIDLTLDSIAESFEYMDGYFGVSFLFTL